MKRLMTRRRIMPRIHRALVLRTRHRSSLRETSRRWWVPFSMPQPCRLVLSHWAAGSWSGVRSVIRPTVSSLRPACWRVSRAALAAKGKPTSSAGTGGLSRGGLWATPLFFFRVGGDRRVGFRGGKTRRWNGNFVSDVFAQGGLVILDGQQIVRSVLQHQLPGGFILSVKGVQGHRAPGQIQLAEEFARDRDFIGLGVHQRTAQVELTGHGDGAQDGIA